MAVGYFISCFLLFAATALLVIATVSSPVWSKVGFLEVRDGSTQILFGVFGYCTRTSCSQRKLGYDIAQLSGEVSDWTYVNNHLEDLTKALILHPIAAGIAGIAFLIALASHRIGFLFSALIAFFAFVVSLVAMIIDFVMFGIIRHEINDNTSGTADFKNAIWMTLAATVILFFASFASCFECCAGRRRTRDKEVGYGYNPNGYVGNQTAAAPVAGRRRWWSRNRNTY